MGKANFSEEKQNNKLTAKATASTVGVVTTAVCGAFSFSFGHGSGGFCHALVMNAYFEMFLLGGTVWHNPFEY